MPYATTSDNVRLYYEEVGQGVPVLFVHEFASDYRGWEPQMREFGKRYRCITYSARGYTPSDVPADVAAYSYQHVMRDAVAVLDHLAIDRAHIVGLSMGGYTTLQVALNHPARVRSMTLAGTGSGSERWFTDAFHKNSRDLALQFEREGSAAVAKTYGNGPSRVPFAIKDARGFAEFLKHLAEHDAQGLGPYVARLPGGAAVAVRFRGRHQAADDPGADRGRRRGRPLHRAEPVPEVGDPGLRADRVSEDRPCGESGRARFVQSGGRRFSCPASTPAAGRHAIRARCLTNRRRCYGTGGRPNLFKAGRHRVRE